MDFLLVNTQELTVLMDLPLIQRVAYLMGIRPYMDKQTQIVGIKRRISYQSLREILYVAPIPGVKTEYPSIQQVRRVVKSLERVGLVAIQSTHKNLILKCVLVEGNKFDQNKAGIKTTPDVNSKIAPDCPVKPDTYISNSTYPDTLKISQADPPLKENNFYLLSQFENFWDLYPLKKSKQKAWEAFQILNPSTELHIKIQSGLEAQIQFYQQQLSLGIWVAAWKFPANWLAQRCWEDEVQFEMLKETENAFHKTNSNMQRNTDSFWESCKSGLEEKTNHDNVIEFRSSRGKS